MNCWIILLLLLCGGNCGGSCSCNGRRGCNENFRGGNIATQNSCGCRDNEREERQPMPMMPPPPPRTDFNYNYNEGCGCQN